MSLVGICISLKEIIFMKVCLKHFVRKLLLFRIHSFSFDSYQMVSWWTFFLEGGGEFERLSEQSIENVRYSASWFLSVGNAVSMHQNNSLHPVWLVIFYVRSARWGFAYYPLETLLSSGQPHVSKKAECDMEKTYAAKWEGGIPWESGNEGSGGQMQSQIFLPWGDFACS